MYSPPPPPPIAPPPTGAGAFQQVQGPAIGLLVTAIIGIVLGLFGLVVQRLRHRHVGLQNIGGGSGATDRYMQYMSGGLGIVFAIIGLAISGFIIWAALQMKQLRNWNMAVAASIVAMIPCIGPCCIIGLPIGIWAIVVLMKPEVKAAFTR